MNALGKPLIDGNDEEYGHDTKLDNNNEEGAGQLSSVFNLSVTILGSGVLAMPFACKECGIIVYLILLAAVACTADFGLNLLINAMESVSDLESLKYKSVALCMLGENGKKATDWAVKIQQLGDVVGACVTCINIISALLAPCCERPRFFYLQLVSTSPLPMRSWCCDHLSTNKAMIPQGSPRPLIEFQPAGNPTSREAEVDVLELC